MNALLIISTLIVLLLIGMKKFLVTVRELFYEDEGSPVKLKSIKINKYNKLQY